MVRKLRKWPLSIMRYLSPVSLTVAVLSLAGCFGDGIQSTIRPESDAARVIHGVYSLVTWIDVGIFLFVSVLLLYAIIRYRHRGDETAPPKQVHGHSMLEVVWTLVPAVILIFIAVPTWSGIFEANRIPTENAIEIEAIGHQWWWEFKYAEAGVVTANEMHVPVGRPIVVKTFSTDVIHSFWLPRLAGKIDSLPGQKNTIWFTPDKTGIYFGQCAEFCGTSHANMRFRVIVDTPQDYAQWLASTKLPPVPEAAPAMAGEKLFTEKGCIGCHAIAGYPGAVGVLGPNLTNLKARATLASAIIENNPENLADWIQRSREIKPDALMILPVPVNQDEAAQLAAFLTSAPGTREYAKPEEAPSMKSAGSGAPTADAGAQLIAAKGCGACHIIPGVAGAVGAIGPSLADLKGRAKIATGTLDNTPEILKRWMKNPPALKPGTLMPNLGLSDGDIQLIIDFLMK